MTKPLKVMEKRVAEAVKRLYRTLGYTVVSFQQPRRTMQTPGIPDLKIYGKGWTWWFEVKAEGGKQSDHQRAFQIMAEASGERYFIGGVEEAIQALESQGLAKRLIGR